MSWLHHLYEDEAHCLYIYTQPFGVLHRISIDKRNTQSGVVVMVGKVQVRQRKKKNVGDESLGVN